MHKYSHNRHPVMLKKIINKNKNSKAQVIQYITLGISTWTKFSKKILEIHSLIGNSTKILVIFGITKTLVSLRVHLN